MGRSLVCGGALSFFFQAFAILKRRAVRRLSQNPGRIIIL